jgi:hypothetical protein
MGGVACMQISDNYAVAAMHCQEFSTAAKAFIDAVKLSSGVHVNTAVLEALVAEVESRRAAQSSMHDPGASRLVQGGTKDETQLGLCSAQQAELDSCCYEEEGKAGDMGEEAARLLDVFATLYAGVSELPVDKQAKSAGAAAKTHDDAKLRQQTMLVRPSFKHQLVQALICKPVLFSIMPRLRSSFNPSLQHTTAA